MRGRPWPRHNPADPRHIAAYPDHGPVSVREDGMLNALGLFFDQYVFGHDRAALLATRLRPATPTALKSKRSISISCVSATPPHRLDQEPLDRYPWICPTIIQENRADARGAFTKQRVTPQRGF